jgi:hypothetical protein
MIYDNIYGQFEEHVKTGDEVWRAGDNFDSTKKIIVGPSRHDCEDYSEDSYEAVNAFWNKVYFDNYEDADRARWKHCKDFTDWIFGIGEM